MKLGYRESPAGHAGASNNYRKNTPVNLDLLALDLMSLKLYHSAPSETIKDMVGRERDRVVDDRNRENILISG